jgi:hypothetical protein
LTSFGKSAVIMTFVRSRLFKVFVTVFAMVNLTYFMEHYCFEPDYIKFRPSVYSKIESPRTQYYTSLIRFELNIDPYR